MSQDNSAFKPPLRKERSQEICNNKAYTVENNIGTHQNINSSRNLPKLFNPNAKQVAQCFEEFKMPIQQKGYKAPKISSNVLP